MTRYLAACREDIHFLPSLMKIECNDQNNQIRQQSQRHTMTLAYLKASLLLSFLAISEIYGATLKGTITLQDGQRSYELITVGIKGTVLGSLVDKNGLYEIEHVPIGRHIVAFYGLTYISKYDTLIVADSNSITIHNVTLNVPLVESNDSLEKYHQRIDRENEKQKVLQIELHGYSFVNGRLKIQVSMHNTSSMPLNILRVEQCILPIEAIVRDSAGKIVRPTEIRVDCVGEKIFPDSNDVITLPEGKTITYPAVMLDYYNFNILPTGKYDVLLKYIFHKPGRLCCYNFTSKYKETYADVIKTYISSLRGEYESVNMLTVENKR